MLNEFNFIFGNDQIYIEFDQNGIAWFYAKQMAKVLEYSHAYNMNRMLIDNECFEYMNDLPDKQLSIFDLE